MAETTAPTTRSRSTTARSPKAKTAATKRSTSAKRAATTRAARGTTANAKRAERKVASQARTEARRAERQAERRFDAVRSQVEQVGEDVLARVEQAGEVAEKVVLTSVGAVLVARDNVAELRETYSTPARVRREINRFERRGTTARNRLERDVKKARTRVERELRLRRREIERTTKPLADQAGLAAARVENTVQEGLLTGTKVASRVTDQAVRIA
jgi:hypothetical protein